MVKKYRHLNHVLYMSLVVLFLTGAWFGLRMLPDGPDTGIWGHLGRERSFPGPFQEEEITLNEGVEILVHHAGRDCSLGLENLPAGFSSFNLTGANREAVLSLLNEEWEIVTFKPHRLRLEYTGELCAHCRELYYIGLYQGKIAVFSGIPSQGVLVEITNYEFKEIYREELEQGIPFTTEAEKKSILESYTT